MLSRYMEAYEGSLKERGMTVGIGGGENKGDGAQLE